MRKNAELCINAKPKKIEEDVFKKYGYVINWDGHKKKESGNLFRIVTRERDSGGWRIAYLIVREKEIRELEQHANSMESFEPIKGRSVLYISKGREPKKIESFFLDTPVVLKKGIWHGVVSLDKEAHIKITENNRVPMKKCDVGKTLRGT